VFRLKVFRLKVNRLKAAYSVQNSHLFRSKPATQNAANQPPEMPKSHWVVRVLAGSMLWTKFATPMTHDPIILGRSRPHRVD
jgi:hypothetical protein